MEETKSVQAKKRKLKRVEFYSPHSHGTSSPGDKFTIVVRFSDGEMFYQEEVDYEDVDDDDPEELAKYFERLAEVCRKHA